MKTCYYIKIDSCIMAVMADLVPMREMIPGEGYLITRINTPKLIQRQGLATALMHEIVSDADQEGMTLALEVAPSGEMSYDALVKWYRSFGFRWHRKYPLMVRRAHATTRDG